MCFSMQAKKVDKERMIVGQKGKLKPIIGNSLGGHQTLPHN
jgi:hypothetical protein